MGAMFNVARAHLLVSYEKLRGSSVNLYTAMLGYVARILESLAVARVCYWLVRALLLVVVLVALALVAAGLDGGFCLVQSLVVVGVIWCIRWLVAGCRRWFLVVGVVAGGLYWLGCWQRR